MSVLSADFSPVTGEAVVAAAAVEAADDLPEDARLYLRHVQGGESVRALARELGCHASTVLRRIRRFESRRDDPLVDRALDGARAGAGGELAPGGWSHHDQEQARRVLRRLAEPGAELIVAGGMDKAIVTRDDIRTAILSRELGEKLALRGWVTMRKAGRITRHVISPAGRAALREMALAGRGGVPRLTDFADAAPVGRPGANGAAAGLAEAPEPFDQADRHRVWQEREITDPEDGERRRARFNLAESPLSLLARRRDSNGRPFLEPGQVAAGERLREDFEMAQMGPRVTQNWDRFMTAGSDSGWRGDAFGGGSEAARGRVATALRELGPGMGDLVLRVCCFLEGIEMTERRLGWPSRSGKIVLRLALLRLERHYEERYGAGGRLIG